MTTFREPVNAWTHLAGAALSIVGCILMFTRISAEGIANPLTIASAAMFSLGLISLYSTSGTYHAIYASEDKLMRWKKLDHSMIFLLIAGSYTPFCLLALDGTMRMAMMTAVWSVAIIGTLMMIFWIGMPRWLNTFLYIFLGWFAVFAIVPLHSSLPAGAFNLLLIGGVLYTIGGIIYGIKKPNISESFGFHELFHVFCLLGSAAHFAAVYCFLLV